MMYPDRGLTYRAREKNLGVIVPLEPTEEEKKQSDERVAVLGLSKGTPKERAESSGTKRILTVFEQVALALQEEYLATWIKKSKSIEPQKQRNEYFYLLKMKTGGFILVVRPAYSEDVALLKNLEEIVASTIKRIEGFPAVFIPQGLEDQLINELEKKFHLVFASF